MKRFFDWLDDRSGYRASVAAALNEPVPGGASFAYVFGSVLTIILVIQMTTGVFLAMYYSPSSSDAWASVAYIQDQVTLGWFVRGLHHHGASAMVIIAGLHLLQTAVYGAYKKPRELNWIVGVMMLGLILAFALTGYLLPWDQTGYWATKVATGIAGTSPVIGGHLQQAVQGGNEYGNLTLTRFFAIHVFILPGAILAMLAFHVALFRRHGVTPRWNKTKAQLARKTAPFWPDQLFLDTVAVAVVFAVLVVINVMTHGAPLDAPADPSSAFDARPEWYFRALFQGLKYFSGTMEQVVALGAPVVVGGFLLALPFVDRGDNRSPAVRKKFLGVLAIGIAITGALTMASLREDAGDASLQKRLAASRVEATKARYLAKKYGVPAAGGIAVYTTEPFFHARRLWAKRCASCHEGDEREAPVVAGGYNSRAWIRALLKDPNADEFFGVTSINKMEPVELEPGQITAVVEFVYAQTGAKDADTSLAKQGRAIFDDEDCSDCHETDGVSKGSGPNLGGRGTVDYLVDFIADSGQKRFFGKRDEMPAFHKKLNDVERTYLAEWIVWLRDQPMAKPVPVKKRARRDAGVATDTGDETGDTGDTGDAGDAGGSSADQSTDAGAE